MWDHRFNRDGENKVRLNKRQGVVKDEAANHLRFCGCPFVRIIRWVPRQYHVTIRKALHQDDQQYGGETGP
jgi:hypothetical protein